MIKAIRKFCFWLGLFGCMCVFIYALMHAAYHQAEIDEIKSDIERMRAERPGVITVAHASHLKTPTDWNL